MNTITVGLLVAACIFAGGLAGLYLHRILPQHHLTKDTRDVIRLGIGMLSVLASLVLGLLIATAKTSYDFTDHAVRNYAAELALLNEQRAPLSLGDLVCEGGITVAVAIIVVRPVALWLSCCTCARFGLSESARAFAHEGTGPKRP
jgi:hypothetical protein